MSQKNLALIVFGVYSLFMGYKFITVKNVRTVASEENGPKQKTYEFQYEYKRNSFSVKIQEESKEVAYKKASKECYHHFTKGVYPGEDEGLVIIDSCANPKKGF